MAIFSPLISVAFSQSSEVLVESRPMTDTMPESTASLAACMASPLTLMILTPSSKLMAPAKQSAEYSPRERPMAQVTSSTEDSPFWVGKEGHQGDCKLGGKGGGGGSIAVMVVLLLLRSLLPSTLPSPFPHRPPNLTSILYFSTAAMEATKIAGWETSVESRSSLGPSVHLARRS